jgi:uncharacterized repeat protein (TIGR01451 family)
MSVAPTLGKAFNLATINPGGVSTLTITLSNPITSVATLTAALADTLPSGVVIAPTPTASTTCGGGTTVIAVAGATTVTLPAGRSIPAAVGTTASTCTVTVNVIAPSVGNYPNTLAANALQTSTGNNAAPAIATLTVASPPVTTKLPPPTIPTTGEWGMMLFAAALLGFMAWMIQARRNIK